MVLRKLTGRQTNFAETYSREAVFFPDSESYYGAFCKIAQQAKERLVIVGWDFDVRVPMQRELDKKGAPSFDMPIGDFLNGLVDDNDSLDIYILIWNSPYLFGTEKDNVKNLAFEWMKHRNIHIFYEDPPFMTASLHEKYVVVDENAAFIGGMDLTAKRWDSIEHLSNDRRRTAPDGKLYPAYHDFQVLVKGDIVRYLSRLAELRWHDATSWLMKRVEKTEKEGIDFDGEGKTFFTLSDIKTRLLLTRPAETIDANEICQIEWFYKQAIRSAKYFIYLENQYFSDFKMAGLLRKRLRQKNGPQVIILIQEAVPEFLGEVTEGNNAAHLLKKLIKADKYNRLSVITPYVANKDKKEPIKVHSKLMVIDCDYISIGSPNVNRRSFQLDYEANAVFEAQDVQHRETFRSFLQKVIALHADVPVSEVKRIFEANEESWRETLKELTRDNTRLQWKEAEDFPHKVPARFTLFDRPSTFGKLFNTMISISPQNALKQSLYAFFGCGFVVLLVIGISYLPELDSRRELIDSIMDRIGAVEPYSWSAVYWGIGITIVCTALMVPVTIPILAFSTLWGGVFGGMVSMLGLLCAAHVYYALGYFTGMSYVTRFEKIKENINKVKAHGTWAVALLKIIPTAPFMVVNFITGAVRFTWVQMFVGSVLGFLPGIVFIALFGDFIRRAMEQGAVYATVVVIGMSCIYLLLIRYVAKLARRAMARLQSKAVA